MDENITELSDALQASLAALTPCQLADELGIHNAHIYRARKGTFSPTLVAAMRREGMIPPRPPYPYFKIRRDRAARAASQIYFALGREYAAQLRAELDFVILQQAGEQQTKERRRYLLRDGSEIVIDEDEYISLEDRGWDW